MLSRHFGGTYAQSKKISCLPRFAARSYLNAHFDTLMKRCAVTILVYQKADESEPNGPEMGILMHVYGETLENVDTSCLTIHTVASSIVLGSDSEIWHKGPAMALGESLVAIAGNYRKSLP